MRIPSRVLNLFTCLVLFLNVAPHAQARELTFPTVANLTHGDVFKVEGSATVYYFGKNDERYIFPDAGTYFSWYSDFDSVKTISASELSQIPLGGMVYDKPFDTLVKTASDATVYWVYINGQLSPIQDESAAVAIAGDDWQTKIHTMDPSTLGGYTIDARSVDESIGAWVGFVEELASAIIFGPNATIAENQFMTEATGVYLYADPERFAAMDETVDCGRSSCSYNQAEVAQNGTLKFVNDTKESVVVVDDEGAWMTSNIPANGGIGVVKVTQSVGAHAFHVVGNEDVSGKLTVTAEDECGGTYLCSEFQ